MDGTLQVSIEHVLARLARFHPVARLLRVGPRIAIDGEVVSRDYRSGWFQLAPGRHRLEVWMRWLLAPRAHLASVDLEIVANETVVARYYAPASNHGPGRIELGATMPAARVIRD